MNRQEKYCDRCGKQMSYQDADGDTEITGIQLETNITAASRGIELSGHYEGLTAKLTSRHSCGTSNKAEYLLGKDFCCVECFEARVNDFMQRVKDFFK